MVVMTFRIEELTEESAAAKSKADRDAQAFCAKKVALTVRPRSRAARDLFLM